MGALPTIPKPKSRRIRFGRAAIHCTLAAFNVLPSRLDKLAINDAVYNSNDAFECGALCLALPHPWSGQVLARRELAALAKG